MAVSADAENRSGPRKPLTLRRRLLAWLAKLAPLLLRPALRLLQLSLHSEYGGDAALRARWANGEQVILAFWHNRLLLLPVIGEGVPMCIMVSHHRDGEVATRLLSAWRIATVRGSASRGAVGGFLRLVDAYRGGRNLVVLPDGPRGPRYVAKPGVVHLAKATGAAIFPIAYSASRDWRLKSWDRLIVPRPFSRLRVEVGPPLSVPPDATPDQLIALRSELEGRLNDLTSAVEAHFQAARR
ncbi:MAG: lysophospholipid acyltransferase family protein [bacterium]